MVMGKDMKEKITATEVLSHYNKEKKRRRIWLYGLLLAVILLSLIGLSVGALGLSPLETLAALFGRGENAAVRAVWGIRMPRVLAALLAGSALSLSGVMMQNILGNPMASPSTLGVSNASAFGANFAILVLGAGSFYATAGGSLEMRHPALAAACAFLAALGSTLLLLGLSARKGFSTEVIVLSGVALGAFFSAGTTVLQYLSSDTQVAAGLFWTFGDLGRASMRENVILFAVLVLSGLYFMTGRWDYEALSGGEAFAKSTGVKVEQRRFFGLLFASLLCATTVSFLGIIGFVGLVAPQITRRLVGSDMNTMLWGSPLVGSAMLLCADILSRALPFGISLPVGAVTSLFGAPVFLLMLIGRKGAGR